MNLLFILSIHCLIHKMSNKKVPKFCQSKNLKLLKTLSLHHVKQSRAATNYHFYDD